MPYLARRLGVGYEDAIALWRELQGMRYTLSPKMVQRLEPRTAPDWRHRQHASSWTGCRPAQCPAPSTVPPTSGPVLPSPKQLAWLLMRPAEALLPADAEAVRWVEQDSEATLVASLARRFTALVCHCGARQPTRPAVPVAELDPKLAQAKTCGISTVQACAAGLDANGAAIRATLTETQGSDQAEALIKRQSYWGASLDPLRTCVLKAT